MDLGGPTPLVVGAVTTLWGALTSVALWAVNEQRKLHTSLYTQERERNQELRVERDEARQETERIRKDHLDGLVKLSSTMHFVTQLKSELEKEAKRVLVKRERRARAKEREGEGGQPP